MNIGQVLEEFGRDYGFGRIALNAANMARLEFDGGLSVDLEYSEQNGLYLNGPVATFGDKPNPALLQALLEANAPAHSREGFVFSIGPADRTILLSHRIEPARLTSAELARVLDRFLGTMETWRDNVRKSFPPDAPTPANAPAPGAWHMRA